MDPTRDNVRRLAMEFPRMVHALEAICEVAHANEQWQQFAGSWVIKALLDEKRESGDDSFDVPPNLRLFLAYGLLTKVGESTRGGRRAYYWLTDLSGTEEALTEVRASLGGLRD